MRALSTLMYSAELMENIRLAIEKSRIKSFPAIFSSPQVRNVQFALWPRE